MHDHRPLFRNLPPPARPTRNRPVVKRSPRGLVTLSRSVDLDDGPASQEELVAQMLEFFCRQATAVLRAAGRDPAERWEISLDRGEQEDTAAILSAGILCDRERFVWLGDLSARDIEVAELCLRIGRRAQGLLVTLNEKALADRQDASAHGRKGGETKGASYIERDDGLLEEFDRRRTDRDAAIRSGTPKTALPSDKTLKREIAKDCEVARRLGMPDLLSEEACIKAIDRAIARAVDRGLRKKK